MGGVVYTKNNKVKAELNVRICIINLPGRNVSSIFLNYPQPSITSLENLATFKLSFYYENFILQAKKIPLLDSFSSLSVPLPVPVSLELSLV